MNKIRTFIVEDRAYWEQEIKSILDKNQSYKAIGSTDRGNRAWKEIQEKQPNLVVIDIDLPDGEFAGFDLARKIGNHYPSIFFVFLTSYKDYKIKEAAYDNSFPVKAIDYIGKNGLNSFDWELLAIKIGSKQRENQSKYEVKIEIDKKEYFITREEFIYAEYRNTAITNRPLPAIFIYLDKNPEPLIIDAKKFKDFKRDLSTLCLSEHITNFLYNPDKVSGIDKGMINKSGHYDNAYLYFLGSLEHITQKCKYKDKTDLITKIHIRPQLAVVTIEKFLTKQTKIKKLS